jgi:hypothetical protein
LPGPQHLRLPQLQHVVLAGVRRFADLSVSVIPAACAGCAFGSFLAAYIIIYEVYECGPETYDRNIISLLALQENKKENYLTCSSIINLKLSAPTKAYFAFYQE